jgi:LmbE family N-acetylglucosaminyl deacetylase
MPNPSGEPPEPRFGRLCVVSPHLDDAVLSAFATLANPGAGPREVVTVVTRGLPGQVTDWSRLTGFADTESEHAARRDEDNSALALLGTMALHLQGVSGDARSVAAAVDTFLGKHAATLRGVQVLLPAGAGRRAPVAERLWRRLRRRADPLGPHPEHVHVRDAFERGLRSAGLDDWGYYAEQPYAWHEPLETCRRRLERRIGTPLRMLRRTPDAAAKLQAAMRYASQAPFALGATPAERLDFCARDEYLFIRQPAPR